MKIILGCGAGKGRVAAPAWQLYTGSQFTLAFNWARTIVPLRAIYILSAKYGLVSSLEVIAPYEAKMGTPSQVITVPELARQVTELGLDQERPLLVNTGKPYRKMLDQVLPQSEVLTEHMNTPCTRMGFQRNWFKTHHRKLPESLYAIYV